MASLMDIGRSAVNAQREALNVTGQNIANIKTEGYRRREANLTEVIGNQSELVAKTSQSGLGVQLGEIRRAFNAYLTESSRNATSRFEAADAFESKIVQLENLLLPREGDLGAMMSAFFSEMSAIAALPGDMSPRAAALEQGKTLASSFNQTALVLEDLAGSSLAQLENDVESVNLIARSLANVNGRLRSSNLGGTPPNALLDERDRLISQLSERMNVTAAIGERFDVEVYLGKSELGPTLVRGEEVIPLSLVMTEENAIKFKLGTNSFLSKIEGGAINGLNDAFAATQSAINDLDTLARKVTSDLNAQHGQGIDLEGELGEPMFTTAEFSIRSGFGNRGNSSAVFNMIPGAADEFSHLEFTYNSANNMWTGRDGDGLFIGSGRSAVQISGGMVIFSGTPKDGDSFTISRIAGDASRMSFLLSRAEQFAAASTFKISLGAGNEGTATLQTSVASTSPTGLSSISDVLNNHLSPVAATEFLRDGVFAVIPANVSAVEFASLKTQPTMRIETADVKNLQSFTFKLDGQEHTFELNASEVGEEAWTHGSQIADVLNRGVIKSLVSIASSTNTVAVGTGSQFDTLSPLGSTQSPLALTINGVDISVAITPGTSSASKRAHATALAAEINGNFTLTSAGISATVTSENKVKLGGSYIDNLRPSLKDLGLFASGFEGGLVIASGQLTTSGVPKSFSAASFKSATSGTVKADVTIAQPASDIQVFTREGRQLAGDPISASEAAILMTPLNGFSTDAEYRADYLTAIDGVGYRGMRVETFKSAGQKQLEIGVAALGSTRSSAQLVAQTTSSKPTEIPRNNTGEQTITVATEDGAQRSITIPAGVAADYISDTLSNELSPLGINIEARTRVMLEMPVSGTGTIGFDLAGSNQSAFKIATTITNGDLTGLAEAINFRSSQTGIVASLNSESKKLVLEHSTGADIIISDIIAGSVNLDVSVLDSTFQPLTNVELNLNSSKVASTPSNITVGSGNFSNELTLASTSGTLAIDIEGVRVSVTGTQNLDTDAQAFATAINTNATLGEIGIRAVALLNGTGKVTLFSNTKSLVQNTRISGLLSLASKNGFTVQSSLDRTTTLPGVSNQNTGGLVSRNYAQAGSTASLQFATNGEIDDAASNVDGTKAQAPSASYQVTLAAVGGPFDVTVNNGETPEATSSSIAAAVAKKMRAEAPVTSIVGAPMESLPPVGSFARFSIDGAEYTLERDFNGLKVSGPEADRVMVKTEDVYKRASSAVGTNEVLGQRHTLLVVGGSMTGSAPAPAFDASAALFGFGSASNITTGADILSEVDPKVTYKPRSILQGRDFSVPDMGGQASMNVAVDGVDIAITLKSNMPTATSNVTLGTGKNYNVLTVDGAATSFSATFNGTTVAATAGAIAGSTATAAELNTRASALATAINGNANIRPDTDGVSQAAKLTQAGALTLGGSLASSGTATFNAARTVTISSTEDESRVTFTITGTDSNGGVSETISGGTAADIVETRTKFLTVTGITSSAGTEGDVEVGVTGLTATASTDGSGTVTINGKVLDLTTDETVAATQPALLSSATAISVTSTGAEDGRSFTIIGTDANGSALTETLIGSSSAGTITTSNLFKTVTQVSVRDSISGKPSATAGTLTVGVSGGNEIFSGAAAIGPLTLAGSLVSSSTVVQPISGTVIRLNPTGATDVASIAIDGIMVTVSDIGDGNFRTNSTYPTGNTNAGAADALAKANNYANRFALAINENTELAAKGISAVPTTNGSGEVSIGRLMATLTPTSAAGAIQLSADLAGGPIIVQGGIAATSLGFKVAEANLLVTETGLRADSIDGDTIEISGSGTSLAETRIQLGGLPKEELIVVVEGGGARRISAEYHVDESSSIDPLKDEKEYEVRMIDSATGRVELFDKSTGHSIATRISSGNAQFEADGLRFNVNGYASTGDSFSILTGQKSAGDATNMDAIIGLSASSKERTSFQDDFRSIAAAVGSTLESSRLSKLSAEAVRDAAVAAEDGVSGVNMDDEAAKLITQQQAYQAAARILQTAKEMFETLLQIR